MSTFNDRERAEEARFALTEEQQFKVMNRRNKLLGLWAAGIMGMGEDDAEATDGEDDDTANAEGEDDDAADAEDGEDDDAEARADKILNAPEAKGREALAGKLAVKVAGGKLTPAEALDMLKTSPKGESDFRKSASAYTPKGAKPGSGAGSGAPKGSGLTTSVAT